MLAAITTGPIPAFNRSASERNAARPKCHSEEAHAKATGHSRAVQWGWGIAPTRPAEEYSRVDGGGGAACRTPTQGGHWLRQAKEDCFRSHSAGVLILEPLPDFQNLKSG